MIKEMGYLIVNVSLYFLSISQNYKMTKSDLEYNLFKKVLTFKHPHMSFDVIIGFLMLKTKKA